MRIKLEPKYAPAPHSTPKRLTRNNTNRTNRTFGMRTPTAALLLPVLVLTCARVDGYRPVIIVHGILDGPKQFQMLVLFINKTHPGTEVTVVDMYNDMSSLKPLWNQVQNFHRAIEPIMSSAQDGVHLLCFSQGGLICRALLSTMPNHNVHNFIALSSPLAGQYGETDYLHRVFPYCIKDTIYLVCYNRLGQKVSICQYWNDPHHRPSYLKNSNFLPLLNGDIPHNNTKSWRENFLRIKKLVLIGGPDDDVITPWQSSHFGFYDNKEHVVEMRNQEFYRNDTFGLKTLNARGDLSLCLCSGVKHIDWHSNFTVFTNCIEKWLT
ncbi:lysosomal thioesterase PPT2-A-like isoform 2-T2 [Syngnathus typhle]